MTKMYEHVLNNIEYIKCSLKWFCVQVIFFHMKVKGVISFKAKGVSLTSRFGDTSRGLGRPTRLPIVVIGSSGNILILTRVFVDSELG